MLLIFCPPPPPPMPHKLQDLVHVLIMLKTSDEKYSCLFLPVVKYLAF